MLRAKADEDNLRRRTEQDIEKAHKFALEKFVNELLPVIDSLDRALEVADKANPELAPMVEGIELTLKSMLDVVRKFGVEVIADTNVPLIRTSTVPLRWSSLTMWRRATCCP